MSYAVRLTASTWRSQLITWFELAQIWSTINKSLILNGLNHQSLHLSNRRVLKVPIVRRSPEPLRFSRGSSEFEVGTGGRRPSCPWR